ncbi:MAG: Pyrazinamidase/nicotinamidase [Candidatus Uhrbacteria bacterium GW2011_GWE2_40_58]|nr:MAG: Pyrazinamidase/nicotinamidase [Candidatus Uhrbacteria bacterium GW2011_GWF2_40_263]KKR67849.1 MAG: Pyrazinamidase/nicotinamidase [Candidatus Uhrbacteria bacterium GW2011_GWE2_40_58]OGL92557.1 MAG: hypothetical protein A2239_04715 [Candidatus Uhrbacteria bacterium RIFOXYA2_FULL_40_9]OGL96821.1 MAG: hypothetical protein A2332_02180 [Candidatus Uhrbacteria bacterium RIFOXYB2_FULL_41_18]HBK34921.1 hypothetical protein [Candidatus Uhrbacteria bacterium]
MLPYQLQRPVFINPFNDMLGIVDVTGGFFPGGGLPVPEAEEIVDPVIQLIVLFGPENTWTAIDCHPYDPTYQRVCGHIAFDTSYAPEAEVIGNKTLLTPGFVSNLTPAMLMPHAGFDLPYLRQYAMAVRANTGEYQVVWVEHSMEGTEQAMLVPALRRYPFAIVIYKGRSPRKDSHSAVFDAVGEPTNLLEQIRMRRYQVRRIFLVGLAFNICVAYTAFDLLKQGFEVYIVVDGTKGIEIVDGHIASMIQKLIQMGAKFVHSTDISRRM